ncbi:MAG: phosphotransacetylase [Evtepia gabavorous]
MFAKLIETLKANPRTLVFTEGSDARILEATARLKKDGFLTPILVGVETEVKAAAEKGGFDVKACALWTRPPMPAWTPWWRRWWSCARKDDPRGLPEEPDEGQLLRHHAGQDGEADCLLGGATYSTADTVRPALQLIKTKPGNSNVSSCFILQREKDGVDERLCMGDCAIQIDPDEDALVETALECAKTAATFGIDPKIAFLSYSTKGSGKGDAVDKVKNACDKAKAAAPELAIDGEMQFDAAVSPVVGQQKFPGSKVAGHANTFIFPEIQSGNIGYKIAQRLGGFAAYGPILQGLNAPINDLSRGCDADEVYKMAIITAALA